MRSLPRFSKTLSIVGSAALLLAVGACGDDDGGTPDARPMIDGGDNPDAPTPDATPTPDAGPADLRSGTLAITDVRVTNDLTGIGIQALSGAQVTITYRDNTAPITAPAMGTGNLDECTVIVYEVGTDPAPTYVDEGAVTVSAGTDHSPFACAFNDTLGEYLCAPATANQSGALGTGSTVVLVDTNGDQTPDTPALVVAGADFTNMNVVGMYVTATGFAEAGNNGTFAVVGSTPLNDSALIIANPDAVPGDTIAATPGTYALTTGNGPVPTLYTAFLGDGSDDVVISKAAGDVVPAFTDVMVPPAGEGLTLSSDSAEPHAMPTTATDPILIKCGGDGECGPSPGTLTGFAISGYATDGDTTGLPPFVMPDPVSKYATFQCRSNPNVTEFQIEAAEWAEVLGIEPTRIQTNILRVTADLSSGVATSMAIGHGLVGFTDVE
jgi:hypothetical protein